MSVITDQATAIDTIVAITAPVTIAMPLLATIAHTRRHHGVGRCSGAGSCETGMTCGPRDVRRLRTRIADALAGLRQPVAISAMIASPTIQAEAVVSSVIDTQYDMVTGSDQPVLSTRRASRWWAVPTAALGLLVIGAILVVSLLPAELRAENPSGIEAPYALVPANAEPVAPRFRFDAVERFDDDGELLFVTVREPELTLLDWFVSNGRDEVRFTSYEEKFGVRTPEQQRQISLELMRTAKETAEYVALAYLGFPVEIIPGDVIVGEIVCLESTEDGRECARTAPSDEVLDPGDQLLSADGVSLSTLDDLTGVLRDKVPGDVIDLEIQRPGEGRSTSEVELIAAPDESGRTIIGFVPFDTASAIVPFEIGIDSGSIGGPSAGLAFTLTLIDELTPGSLTGGTRVAVTGTINIDGSVGAIGGLVQKTSAAKEMGAEVFLVPTSQGEDDIARARGVAGDMTIVPVATLEEALTVLADYGGNGLDLGQPGLAFDADADADAATD